MKTPSMKNSRNTSAHRQSGVEYLYGLHPVHEALLARRRDVREVWLTPEGSDRRREKVAALAQKQGIAVRNITVEKLRSHVGRAVHQGVAAVAGPLPRVSLNSVLPSKSSPASQGIWLFLDSIVDPHNLGAIIRTALCIGVKAVIIPKDRSALPSPAVSKASAGALEHINLCSVTNLANTIKEIKAKGVWAAGLDAAAGEPLYGQDLSVPLALIVGGEEKGIRPRVKKQCDFLLTIPQVGRVSSLNASVAAAVVMFEAFRQQGGQGAV